jgi:hypothetical protein
MILHRKNEVNKKVIHQRKKRRCRKWAAPLINMTDV